MGIAFNRVNKQYRVFFPLIYRRLLCQVCSMAVLGRVVWLVAAYGIPLFVLFLIFRWVIYIDMYIFIYVYYYVSVRVPTHVVA